MKGATRILCLMMAVLLCFGILAGTLLSVFAAENTSDYAATDYATKSEEFAALCDASGDTVTFPLPAEFNEASTLRMKYIVPAKTVKEKYKDKTFVMPFVDVTLTVKGSYIANLGENADRVEFYLRATEPFKKNEFDAAGESDGIRGASSVIKGETPHPVVGDYVYEIIVYVDGASTYDFGAKDNNIVATLKADTEAYNKAKESAEAFNVYAYLDKTGNIADATYDNMKANISADTGEAKFTVQYAGWFFLAADETAGISTTLIIIIVAVAVVVIAAVVIILMLTKKKPNANA